jgi:hypothetical protein
MSEFARVGAFVVGFTALLYRFFADEGLKPQDMGKDTGSKAIATIVAIFGLKYGITGIV